MTFNEIMNSPLLYGLVGLGIVYICLLYTSPSPRD